MSAISPNYASKLAIARELAILGARAVTITAVARTKPADSRNVHKEIRGHQSQSGQTPTDHIWFVANRTRRLHAAFFLITYVKYRIRFEPLPDAVGLAFSMAYRDYIRIIGKEQPISPERLNLLVTKGYEIGWKKILSGGESKFKKDNVKVVNCKKCKVPHLVESHYLNYVCTAC